MSEFNPDQADFRDEKTPDYALTDFERKVRDIIAAMLREPALLPEEFKAYLGPYLETLALQVPAGQIIGGAFVPVGTIVAYGGSTPPEGWLLCNGQDKSRTKYNKLFEAIGTVYGSGDGSTTFDLPDLQDRFPIGRKSGTAAVDTLGETGGTLDPGDLFTVTTQDLFTLGGAGSAVTAAFFNGALRPPYQVVNFIIRAF